VREPIHLHRNPRLEAVKVEIIWPMLVLLAKFEVVGALLEHVPQSALRRCHRFA
jgi:hypothetical protein